MEFFRKASVRSDDEDAKDNALFAVARVPALVKLVRELQQLDHRRYIGSRMANVMFNLKQRSPLVLTETERDIVVGLQKEWDLLSRTGVPQEDKQ
jgi:hypothetical protein